MAKGPALPKSVPEYYRNWIVNDSRMIHLHRLENDNLMLGQQSGHTKRNVAQIFIFLNGIEYNLIKEFVSDFSSLPLLSLIG